MCVTLDQQWYNKQIHCKEKLSILLLILTHRICHTCALPCQLTPPNPSPPLSHLQIALFDMPNLNRFDILSISIFCKIALSISISISIFSKITISISISISIFLELPYRYRYRYRYFSELPYRYRYRYRYFSKVSIYRQSICHIDISNRARGEAVLLQFSDFTKDPMHDFNRLFC